VDLICETYSATLEVTSKHYFYHCIIVTICPLVGPHDRPSGSFSTAHYPFLATSICTPHFTIIESF